MFFVNGERASEAHLLEVPPSTESLRSRGVFLIVSYSLMGMDSVGQIQRSWLWVGANAPELKRSAADFVVERLKRR